MKSNILTLFQQALEQLQQQSILPPGDLQPIQIEHARDKRFGDYATNIAMVLAKTAKKNPRELAQLIIDHLPASDLIKQVDLAGPGFINITLNEAVQQTIVADILSQADSFGQVNLGQGQKIIIEYVSANPTGPLHVGHGRSAVYGSCLSNLMSYAGFDTSSEYYVNDAGRQMSILATSVWLRYLALFGNQFNFPENGYKGDYVIDIANDIKREHNDAFLRPIDEVFHDIPADEPQGGDKEIHIDALIARCKDCLQDQFQIIHDFAISEILDDIRNDLAEFGITFDQWFSEKSLFNSGDIERGIQALKQSGHTYEKEGALWFNAVHYGDDKDRVLIRANGQTTYFASDVAYHKNKLDRGFDRVIDIFGADHHGYVPRVKASVKALGANDDQIEVKLVQFAILYRGKVKISMTTRGGNYVTLRDLRQEVGNDAARFFYIMRKSEQHMDFDLELAKSQSMDNPVYYIQYAHARICSVLSQQVDINAVRQMGLAHLNVLTNEHEKALLQQLARFPEVIGQAAKQLEPHQIAHYLRELANLFHAYYNAHQFLVEQADLRNARLCLIIAIKQIIQNGLTILGITAPEQM